MRVKGGKKVNANLDHERFNHIFTRANRRRPRRFAPFDFIQRTRLANPNYEFFKALCARSSAVANFIKKHYLLAHREKEPRHEFPITFFQSDSLSHEQRSER